MCNFAKTDIHHKYTIRMRNPSILMAILAIAGFSACNHHAEKASSDGTLSSGPGGTYIEKEVYRDSNVGQRTSVLQ